MAYQQTHLSVTGIEVDDALEVSESIEILAVRGCVCSSCVRAAEVSALIT